MAAGNLLRMAISACFAGISTASPGQAPGWCMHWSVCAELPPVGDARPNPGVAGPFTGVSGGVMLIAGGANFPAGKPWEGGRKAYTDEIYIVRREEGGGFSCRRLDGFHLPEKIAYGASVTVAAGVVCIGGETAGGYSSKVFMMSWDGRLHIDTLPDLPKGMASACAAVIGSTIYVAGGEDAREPLGGFYCLDLEASSPGWVSLPALPVAMSHAVAVAQGDGARRCVYVIGGRSKTGSGISVLHHTAFRYDPHKGSWERLADIRHGHTIDLSAASAVAYGDHILVIGGDRGDIFHRIEVYNARIAGAANDSAAAAINRRKLKLVLDHPGFSHAILAYEVRGNRWRKIGTLPGDTPVTTTAVWWDGEVFLPCGEVRPGVRSSVIWRGIFCDQ